MGASSLRGAAAERCGSCHLQRREHRSRATGRQPLAACAPGGVATRPCRPAPVGCAARSIRPRIDKRGASALESGPIAADGGVTMNQPMRMNHIGISVPDIDAAVR
jgi:hypothetical protein